MTTEINCTWMDDMHFTGEVDGHVVNLDADVQFGGQNKGPRPKPLLLVSLAGCTGMDVVSMLNKMRVSFDYFNVRVVGELTEDMPKYYKKIEVIYEFQGDDLPMDKLQRAAELSQEKYCGVSALLKKGCELTYRIVILGAKD